MQRAIPTRALRKPQRRLRARGSTGGATRGEPDDRRRRQHGRGADHQPEAGAGITCSAHVCPSSAAPMISATAAISTPARANDHHGISVCAR
jgi:hypothetical protein